MAYNKKTTNVKKETTTSNETVETTVDVAETKVITENTNTLVSSESTTKTYNKDDAIPCKSITNGKLFVTGEKTGILYRWADYGDVEEVEYQDLVFMVRSKKPCVYRPRFIIQDADFVAQFKDLEPLYESLYTSKDLKEILNLPVSQMRKAIEELPDGAKEALKGIAASAIMSGRYDSVAKIKVLDEIFDTNLLLTLAQA